MLRMIGLLSFIISGGMGRAPAFGSSTLMPSASSGAVIMKMMSSTSITSMYGTTLISPMSLRRRRGCAAAMAPPSGGRAATGVALQDGGELFHERVVAQFEAAHLVRIAVVGDHRRN